MNMIYEYYLKEVMSKAIGAGASWSIYDGLQSKKCHGYVKSARGEKSVTFNDNSEKIFVFKKEKST